MDHTPPMINNSPPDVVDSQGVDGNHLDDSPPVIHDESAIDNSIPEMNPINGSENEVNHLPPDTEVEENNQEDIDVPENENTTLYVTLSKANLPENVSECFCKMTNEISGEEVQTKKVGSNQPVFNEDFMFNVFDWENTFVNVDIFESSMHPEIKIGSLQLQLGSCNIADQGKAFSIYTIMNPENEAIGQIEISLSKFISSDDEQQPNDEKMDNEQQQPNEVVGDDQQPNEKVVGEQQPNETNQENNEEQQQQVEEQNEGNNLELRIDEPEENGEINEEPPIEKKPTSPKYKKPVIPQKNMIIEIIPGTTMGNPPVEIKLPEFEPRIFIPVVQRFSSQREVLCKKMDSSKQQKHSFILSDDRKYFTLKNLQTRLRKKRVEAVVPFAAITKVIIGDNQNFNGIIKRKKHKVSHSNIFTIYYNDNDKSKRIDFIMKNEEEFSAFFSFFSYMVRLNNLSNDSDTGTIELFKTWLKADVNNDGQLSLEEIENVLRDLQLKIEKHQLLELFDEFDVDQSGSIEFNEFVAFYNMLRAVPFIEKLFKKYATTSKHILHTHEFKQFLTEIQGAKDLDEKKVSLMMDYLNCQKNENGKIVGMNKSQFYNYIVGHANNLAPNKLTQAMDQPLTHYTIFSSHHSYLMHNQLKGVSSIAQYERYLDEGVRYLEIDCWSGISSPMITHGRTLTTKIPFLPTLEAIKKVAFTSSTYPLILSFSFNDCSDSEMFFIATKLGSVLGQQNIFIPEIEDANNLPDLPSPDQLQGKYILILNRKYSPKHNDHLHRIFGHMEPYVEYYDEDECYAKIEANPIQCVQDCFKKLTIVSPKMTRFTSSNYPILKPLHYGFSNISLNLQTVDEETQLARHLFKSQGGTGYILKPNNPSSSGVVLYTLDITLISGLSLPAASKSSLPPPAIEDSNQEDEPHLPPQDDQENEEDRETDVLNNEYIDPYVEFKINGLLSKSVRSKVVHDNGFKPKWNEKLQLPLTSLEFDILSINIFDSNENDDELLLSKDIPINAIREGVRTIHFDQDSKLFVKCTILEGDHTQ